MVGHGLRLMLPIMEDQPFMTMKFMGKSFANNWSEKFYSGYRLSGRYLGYLTNIGCQYRTVNIHVNHVFN